MENTVVRSEIDEIRSVRRQIAAWRSILTVVLLAAIVISVFLIGSAAKNLVVGNQRDKFAQLMGERMQNDVLPRAQEVGQDALRRIDFNKQISDLNKQAPRVANTAMKELRLLSTNIPASGKKILNDEFTKALEAQAATLQQEFPDASEEDIQAFLGELTAETQVQLTEVTDTLFNEHLVTMQDIVDDIKLIQQAEGASAKGDIPTWDMALLLVDIARAEFSMDSEAAAGKGMK